MVFSRILALSLVSAVAVSARPAHSQQPAPREPIATIASSASADARYNPDRATVSIAVQTKAATAAAAAADNSRKQAAVLSALRALGMTDAQLSTTGYNVNPDYRYGPNQPPSVTGYTVTNTVLADVHDLTQIGKVLDAALAHGSNLISSLDFYAANTDAARQKALTDAVVKARADAQVAATAAGGKLGDLIHLEVGGASAPPPRPMFMAKAVSGSTPETQINPGAQTITVSVSGSWRFLPAK